MLYANVSYILQSYSFFILSSFYRALKLPQKYYKFNFIDIQSKCILHLINNNVIDIMFFLTSIDKTRVLQQSYAGIDRIHIFSYIWFLLTL